MQRFLKRRAEEAVDLNRDAGTHAKVPLEKKESLLRYMFVYRSASMEGGAVVKPTPRENHGLLRYMSTSSSASKVEAASASNSDARKNNLRKKTAASTIAKNDTLLRFMSTSGSASMGVTVATRNAPGKVNGLLRYMSTSSIRSVEVANAARNAAATKNKLRKEAAALIASTGCSQAVAAKHLQTNYANLIGVRSRKVHILDFPDCRIRHRITGLGLPWVRAGSVN